MVKSLHSKAWFYIQINNYINYIKYYIDWFSQTTDQVFWPDASVLRLVLGYFRGHRQCSISWRAAAHSTQPIFDTCLQYQLEIGVKQEDSWLLSIASLGYHLYTGSSQPSFESRLRSQNWGSKWFRLDTLYLPVFCFPTTETSKLINTILLEALVEAEGCWPCPQSMLHWIPQSDLRSTALWQPTLLSQWQKSSELTLHLDK